METKNENDICLFFINHVWNLGVVPRSHYKKGYNSLSL